MKNLLSKFVFIFPVVVFLSSLVQAAPPEKKVLSFVPGSWTIVVLPDTQYYTDKYPGLFDLQTHWIVKHKGSNDIRYVFQLGDLTDSDKRTEWIEAKEALDELNGHVPYAFVPGNKDYKDNGRDGRKTKMEEFFLPSEFKSWPTFGGAEYPLSMENSYHLFSAGGIDWIVLALEWAPRDTTISWAEQILKQHPKRKAILITHAYLNKDNRRFDYAKLKEEQQGNPHEALPGERVNDGEELWQKLVKKHDFAFVFCGHITGAAYLASKNDLGGTTHQIMTDYQNENFGGGAYMKLIEFLPDGKKVQVKAYSPLYDKYLTDKDEQFTLELDK